VTRDANGLASAAHLFQQRQAFDFELGNGYFNHF
jgi:hypothetical protein